MCTLIAEFLMLVGGVYALIAGKVRLTKNLHLEGWRARVAGLILMTPLPLALLMQMALASLLARADPVPESVSNYGAIIHIALVLLALVAVVIFGYAVREKAAPEEPQPPADLS